MGPKPRTEQQAIARLERRVRSALEEVGLAGGRLLVVAVSGGPDSLALLYALHRLKDDLGLRLHGAHLDHRLRGLASEADARFVADILRGLGILGTVEAADVAAYRRRHRLSLEQAARQVRYAFLARVASEQGADAVALGHTADDQAETVLLHLVRGSGLAGLRGMAPLSRQVLDGRGVVLVRPMLEVTRQETLAYCQALGLSPRQDESNLYADMARNRVRLQLVPLLRQFNPAIRDALLRLSRSVARDLAYLEAEVERVWPRVVARQREGVLALSRAAFSALPDAIQGHLLRRAVLEMKGDLENVEQVHVEEMVRLMAGPAGKSLALPGGLSFAVSYGQATLARSGEESCPLPPLEEEYRLQVPGETAVPGWRVTVRLARRGEGAGVASALAHAPDGTFARFDYAAIGGELVVRRRRPGDRFQPLGMGESKKLQDFMVDARVPRPWRDRVPLVVAPRGIAWVVGWRIAEWARVTEGTGQELHIEFSPT